MPTLLQIGLSNAAAATLLAVLAYLAVRARARPAVAHALWMLVLVKLLTPPLVPLPVATLREPAAEPTRVARVKRTPAEPPAIQFTRAVAKAPDLTASDPGRRGLLDPKTGLPLPPKTPRAGKSGNKEAGTTPQADEYPTEEGPGPSALAAFEETDEPQPATSGTFPWWASIAAVWLLGAGFCVVVSLRRVQQFQRLLQHARPAPADIRREFDKLAARIGFRRPPALKLLPGSVSPMVWAVGRAAVYFPAELLAVLNADQRRTLLTHELAHLKRRDHWLRWVELLALSLYWWLPAAWLARRGLHQAEEECCDAWVVETLPSSGRSYAEALLDTMDFLAESPRATPALASGVGQFAAFRRRLLLILADRPRLRLPWLARAGVTALAAIALALAPTLATAPAEAARAEPLPASPPPAALAPAEPTTDPFGFEQVAALLPAPTEQWEALAYSSDGRTVALGGESGVIVLWDLSKRQLLGRLTGHREAVTSLAFSADGKQLVSGSYDKTVRVWDMAARREVQQLTGHANVVWAVAFAPDGTLVASGSYDRTVRVWRISTGDVVAEFKGHTGSVRGLAFSPDGVWLASASADHTVRIWHLWADQPPLVLRGYDGMVRTVAFQPGGRLLATGSEDGMVRVWDWRERRLTAALAQGDIVASLAFGLRGRLLLSGGENGLVHVWDASTGRLRASIPAHGDRVAALAVAPNGRYLLTASHDRTVRIWPAKAHPSADDLVEEGRWWMNRVPPLGPWLDNGPQTLRNLFTPRREFFIDVGFDSGFFEITLPGK
jgi:beta-lactamase regulating signal transducer with metallopeptidase domain